MPADAALPPELVAHPHYRIERELGRGGMGVVYLAHNTLLDRPEVIKVVTRELVARPGTRERFLQEVRSAARLSHPNIVTAYAALADGDFLALAMEYIRGEPLDTMLDRGPVPVQHAVFFAAQAALGLQYAHEMGMVHRDIKPGNLMATTTGRKTVVKVLDFGLAKATSERADEGNLTASGIMLGTPRYVAPEQAQDAASADIRADIYSLGCTLYHLLTGRPPFTAPSVMGLLYAHLHTPPTDPREFRPEIPGEVAAAVLRMMAKAPAARFSTQSEAAKALGPFAKTGGGKLIAGGKLDTPDPLDGMVTVLPPPTAERILTAVPTATIASDLPRPMDAFAGIDETARRSSTIAPKPRRLPAVVWGLVGLAVVAGGTATVIGLMRSKPVATTSAARDVVVAPAIKPAPPPTKKDEPKPDEPPTPDDAGTMPPEIGFTRLFDGATLAGWEPHPDHPGNWRVENGLLVGEGEGEGVSALLTKADDYANVRVRARLRVTGTQAAAIRLYARAASAFGTVRPNLNLIDGWCAAVRPRAQVQAWAVAPGSAADFQSTAVKPGEWFTLEAEATDATVIARVNGVEVSRVGGVADRVKKGRVAIHHLARGKVEVATIEVKRLDVSAPPPPPPPAPKPTPKPPAVIPPPSVPAGWKFVEMTQADINAGKAKLKSLDDKANRAVWLDLPAFEFPKDNPDGFGPKYNYPLEVNRAFTMAVKTSNSGKTNGWGISVGDAKLGRVAVYFSNAGTYSYGPWPGNVRLRSVSAELPKGVERVHPAILKGASENVMTVVRRPTRLEVYANGVAVCPPVSIPEKLGTELWIEWVVGPNEYYPSYHKMWLYDVSQFETPFYKK